MLAEGLGQCLWVRCRLCHRRLRLFRNIRPHFPTFGKGSEDDVATLVGMILFFFNAKTEGAGRQVQRPSHGPRARLVLEHWVLARDLCIVYSEIYAPQELLSHAFSAANAYWCPRAAHLGLARKG